MMPADLKRLHKYMLEVEHIGVMSDEMREVVQSEWSGAGVASLTKFRQVPEVPSCAAVG
jgi:hypothetical protein